MAQISLGPRDATRPTRLVFTPANSHERNLALGVIGARPQEDNYTLTFPPEPLVIRDLHRAFNTLGRKGDGVTIGPDARAWYDRVRASEYTSRRIARLSDAACEASWSERLHPYQRVGTMWLETVRRGILGDEMGLGKTIESLTAARRCRSVLVVTVNLAKRSVWQRHVEQWLGRSAWVAEGTREERTAILAAFGRSGADGFLIVNHEMLQSAGKADEPWRPIHPALFAAKWDAVILDEAQKFQGHDSQQSKGANHLRAARLFLLTGTPVWNRPESIWHLLHLIDPARWSSYWRFVEEYCEVTLTPWAREVVGIKPGAMDRLHTVLSPIVLHRETAEVLPQLPEKIVQQIDYDLTPMQRMRYKELKKEFRLLDEVGAVVKRESSVSQTFADLIRLCNAPALLRLPAIASAKDAVIDELLDPLLDEERSVVIFTWHKDYARYLVERLTGALGVGVGLITGDLSVADREAVIDGFAQATRPCILVATIASTGVAIDLTAASAAIFAEGSYVPTLNQQAEKRLHRIGQKSSVLIYRLAASNTVESALWEMAEERQDMADEMLAFSDLVGRTLAQSDD